MRHVSKICNLLLSVTLLMVLGCFVWVVSAQTTPQTATVLLTDISGSMEELDAFGTPKIDAAKDAIYTYTDVVEAESNNAGNTDLISLVTFCDTADLRADFTSDYNSVRAITLPLMTCGSTDMYSGFLVSDNLVTRVHNQQTVQTNIILLSDGLPTSSPNNPLDYQQEVLNFLPRLNDTNTCLYIVPIGNPNSTSGTSIDLTFLQQMDAIVDCGQLFPLSAPDELQQRYLEIRLQIIEVETVTNTVINVFPNETVLLDPITVAPNTPQLRVDTVVLNGGTVDVTLTDPNGQVVDSTYAGARLSTVGDIVQWIISDPIAGQWRGEVTGTSALPTGTRVQTSVSTGNGFFLADGGTDAVNSVTILGILAVILLIAGGVIAGVLYNQNQRISQMNVPASQQAALMFLNGPRAGQQITVGTQRYTIGRRAGNDLQLQDSQVSREHARIILDNGRYMIQDLNSQSGTLVNNQRVRGRRTLTSGDQISMGKVTLQFIQW